MCVCADVMCVQWPWARVRVCVFMCARMKASFTSPLCNYPVTRTESSGSSKLHSRHLPRLRASLRIFVCWLVVRYTCVCLFSQSPSVFSLFSFVTSCQPDTSYIGTICSCVCMIVIAFVVFASKYVCVCSILLLCMCVYLWFTFFPSSAALASLVSTLVWSTMLSVGKKVTEEKKEREGKRWWIR